MATRKGAFSINLDKLLALFFFWRVIAISCLVVSASVNDKDLEKKHLAPLTDISFDTSTDIVENRAVYVVSMEERSRGRRPLFSIYKQSEDARRKSDEIILAKAVWQDRMNQTGWNHLSVDIIEHADASDNHKSYAAGLLEGFLSRSRIRDFFLNTRAMIHAQKGGPQSVKPVWDVFRKSIERVKNVGAWNVDNPLNSAEPPHTVDHFVRLAVFQIWGISDAYEAARDAFHPNESWHVWPKIDVVDMHFLSADGDFPDLKDAVPEDPSGDDGYDPKDFPNTSSSDDESTFFQTRAARSSEDQDNAYVGTRRRQYGRCSALVRLANDDSELFVGHSTWEPFSEMTRIIKFYDFPFKGVAARRLAFPSYPGAITSTDDFIVTSAGLVLTETTIDVTNRKLFGTRSGINDDDGRYSDFVRPILAARLATSARNWVHIFTESSDAFLGIASCQWMVVDYNKFEKHLDPKGDDDDDDDDDNGFFYLLESIPGLIRSKDMSRRIKSRRYWGSTNRAWFRDVRDVLGDDVKLDNDTSLLSVYSRVSVLEENPRAFAFKHLAPQVNTLHDMERLMQFSAAPPEAGGPPSNVAIAPRFDLTNKKLTPEGATDSKIVDSSLIHDLAFIGISGPEHQRNQPFSWVDEDGYNKWDANIWPHQGLPRLWNFSWYLIEKTGLMELETPASLVREFDYDDWSDELSDAIRKRNQTENLEREADKGKS